MLKYGSKEDASQGRDDAGGVERVLWGEIASSLGSSQ